jgi:predicted transposase/invertase (TIGR01784 family)
VDIFENKTFSPDAVNDKSVIFDVRAVLQGETRVNVEVQLRNQFNMDKRSLFYWGKEFTKTLKKGQDYQNLPRVIAINIVDYEFSSVKNYHSCYHLREDTETDIILTDTLEIHFLDMVKYRKLKGKDIVHNPLNRWLAWFNKGSSPELLAEVIRMDAAIQAANERLMQVTDDEEIERAIWRRQMAICDYNESMAYARDKGYEEGHERGREQGLEQGRIEIARKMKNRGRSLAEIVDDTGLPPNTIEQL